ncbi:MAG: hypothetical protein N2115_03335 [bacterium]|nr:hypothetical protein [bacterium]
MSVLILILLVLNAISIARFFKSSNPAENLLLFFSFFYGLIAGIFSTLGIFGCASKKCFAIFLLIILLILIILNKNRSQFLKTIQTSERYDFFSSCAGIFLLSCFLATVLTNRFLPPVTTDGIYYHLPFAGRWFQTGRLDRVPLYFTDIAMTYYPLTGDIFYLFHFIIFGSDIYVNLIQMPFAIYSGCAIYLILKKFNISHHSAFFSACLFIAVRPIFKQTSLIFVVLMLTAFYFSSMYFLISLKDIKNAIIPAAITLGMLVGTKTSGLLLLATLLPFIFFNKTKLQNKLFLFPAVFLIFIITGFWWYIDCWIQTGNPLYPVKFLALNGLYLFPKENLALKLQHLFNVIISPYKIDAPLNIFIFLTALWILTVFTSRKNKQLKYFLLLPGIILILYIFIFPTYYYQMRHLLVLYGVLCSSLGILFDKIVNKNNQKISDIAKFLVLILFFLFSVSSKNVRILIMTIFICFFLLFAVIAFHPNRKIKKIFPLVIGVIIFVPVLNFRSDEEFYKHNRMNVFKYFYGKQAEIWNTVDSYKTGQRKVVAYAGDYFIFPFYGRNLENYVYYQPVNKIEETPIHHYPVPISKNFSPDNFQELEIIYRSAPDFHVWLEGLKKHNTQLLIIKKRRPDVLIEETWADSNPSLFILLFENEIGKVYRIEKNNSS